MLTPRTEQDVAARRNNTRTGGIIKNQGREGEEYTKERSTGGRDMIYIRRLSPSESSFRAKFLARIPASDLDSSFIRPSFSNSIDPIQHSTHPSVQERERLDHAVGEQTDRPNDRSARSPVRPVARPPLSSHQHFESREITFLSSVHLTPPAPLRPPQYVNPSPSPVPVVQKFKAAAAPAAATAEMVSQKQLC